MISGRLFVGRAGPPGLCGAEGHAGDDQVHLRQLIIKTNMERWRWLPRDLGKRYVFVNVPEYMVALVGKGKNIATYRAIVGAPKTATPQLDAQAIGMIIHPTWTIRRASSRKASARSSRTTRQLQRRADTPGLVQARTCPSCKNSDPAIRLE